MSLFKVLAAALDPILLLFLTGFMLGAAAREQGIDHTLVRIALKLSKDRIRILIVLAAVTTVFLSMWMSNIAAASLMFAAFRPIWGNEPHDSSTRRSLLLIIALSANIAGVTTPVATGPNGIAMATINQQQPLHFLQWMGFGVPLALGLLCVAVALIFIRLRPAGTISLAEEYAAMKPAANSRAWQVWLVAGITIAMWIFEPFTGVQEWIVAAGAIVALFILRLIGWKAIAGLDWKTIALIAAGLMLGELLNQSGLVYKLTQALPLLGAHFTIRLFVLCFISALLSALMSNTATAGFLVPLALSLDPMPSTAIIVAIAASMGMPFVISTPPNAMAVGGGLRSSDLLVPGLIFMLGGSLLVAVTGPMVLRGLGIP